MPIYLSIQTIRKTKINEFSNFLCRNLKRHEFHEWCDHCISCKCFSCLQGEKIINLGTFCYVFSVCRFCDDSVTGRKLNFCSRIQSLVWEPNCSISGVFNNQGSTLFLSYIIFIIRIYVCHSSMTGCLCVLWDKILLWSKSIHNISFKIHL